MIVLEKNLDLELRLTLRRSYQDISCPKIIFHSSVNAIEFLFQRSQVSIFVVTTNI